MNRMKIVLIGCSGHSIFCLPDKRDYNRDFLAIAPGSVGESVDGMVRLLSEKGYKPKKYSDYKEMLYKEKPDIVVVDNFYGEHCDVILTALEAGCHVFAEKPIATNIEQLEKIKDAWYKAGTKLSCMFDSRYNGAFYCAWKLIKQGSVGKVRMLNAQKSYKYGVRPDFMNRRDSYGGTIPWVGIHAIDWILWLSGADFCSVTAIQSAAEAENKLSPETTALCQFLMSDEIMASLTIDYLNPPEAADHGEDRIRVVGTEGVLEVRRNEIILTNTNGVQKPIIAKDEDMFLDFLEYAAGKSSCRILESDVFAATEGAIRAQIAADQKEIVYFK